MSYFKYEYKKIYYDESGEGIPLILLHGNTSCGKMFEPIVPTLAAKYRVIVPDFLGNGRSDRLDIWPSDLWFDWAKQVKALCDYLELKKVMLIGSSGGALAAINVALEYPELVEFFIADSFEGLKADPEITEQIRNGRAQAKTIGAFTEYLKTLHGDDWERVFDADTDAVLRHAEQIREFFHKPIEKLKVPMLLIGSLEDDMFPKGHCKVLFSEICAKTSLAKSHIFEYGGHPAMLSNMDEFVELFQ
ncbi:MAG: alpha/beta hydrolase, partial [Lachnospiraceae bacterium]|nr:alpha/beta hydrolase [Lachnospiraceae bacterium]